MIVDSAIIHVKSGRGGDGCVSFRREKFVPKGGPDGGDGGKGGDVILLASPEVETLLDFAGRHHWHAPGGQPGAGKQRHGRDGDDLIVNLPPGTLVYDNDCGEQLVDLAIVGRRVVIAQGGRGGFGNEHFKNATNQTPTQCTPGEPAVELNLRLELKLIADVGLVGKPNAGKSTLLSRVSAATPKIADYPFTTLEPNLGIAELPGSGGGRLGDRRRLTFADIPGLIENAHAGAGLGTRFLRHVERTRLLVHLVEVEPADGSDPIENYHAIRRELAEYAADLASKPELVALSKMDICPDERDRAAVVRRIETAVGRPVLPISAVTGRGLRELLEACWRTLGAKEDDSGWSM